MSYRRHDTQSATGRLCDKLQLHFGADRVFHDIESIDPGSDFAATITAKIAASSIVLVVIGQRWLETGGGDGRPRLFDSGDYVCLEIAAALRRGIPVIPVLVEGASMPPASALPESIVALAARQWHEITEQRWQYDSGLLVTQLEVFVPPERKSTEEDVSTLRQTLLQSVASLPSDFIQLLVHPRRHLAALLDQPNFVLRAAVFFTISHIAAGWLVVMKDLVASVPAFALAGVPVGAFNLLLMVIPVHLAARVVRAPSHAPSTMVMLAYIQSVAMVLLATGAALIWTGLMIANPEIGPNMRAAVYSNLPLEVRVAQFSDVVQPAMGGPFMALFVLANLIWLCTAGWLLVATAAFRDVWRISRLRAAAIAIMVTMMLAVAGAIALFAATL